jgi:CRP-like cAMP-binding protein
MGNRRKSPVEIEAVAAHTCSIDLRLEILGKLPFLASLSADELAAANKRFRAGDYAAGEAIYFTGDPATHLYVVASGQVRLMQHSPMGKDVLLDVLQPGEFFGSLTPGAGEPFAETAQAQANACILGINAEDFRELMTAYPPVALAVLDLTTRRLLAAQETVRRLSAYPMEQRLAAMLVRLAEKLGEPHPEGLLIQTRLSREDLAQMTAATPETVSRIMAQFQKEGLVNSGRQWVAITDLDGLKRLAED